MEQQYPKVSIPGSQVRMLTSSVIEQEFSLFIALPPDYDSSEKIYPVLYVLDANVCFGMVKDIVRGLNLGQELPDMIIVGVAYPVDYYPQTIQFRSRDYTPTRENEEDQHSGGAANFMKFIQSELFPFIDKNYRTDQKDRAIFGYSFGGLFTLYTLFHQPTLFQRYVVSSPTVTWDEKVTFAFENQYALKNTHLPAKVFMSVGTLEDEEIQTELQRLDKVILERNYAGLEFRFYVFENETHLSVPAASISKGLRAVFAQP